MQWLLEVDNVSWCRRIQGGFWWLEHSPLFVDSNSHTMMIHSIKTQTLALNHKGYDPKV